MYLYLAGAAVVLQDVHNAMTIAVPSAMDADGRNLAVRTRVEGNNVSYTVDHRGADVRYPRLPPRSGSDRADRAPSALTSSGHKVADLR